MATPTQPTSGSENPLQMPKIDLVTNLISSVNNLKASVYQLQQDNDILREKLEAKAEDLAILQRNSSELFPQFKVRSESAFSAKQLPRESHTDYYIEAGP